MKGEKKRYSVAVCTHNRGSLLEPLLEKLLQLNAKGEMEILVIDNSTRKKDIDMANELKALKGVKVFRSEPPGISRARNKAIEVCSTDIICYLDDDAVPYNNWNESIVRPFDDPKVAVVAGPIDPVWPATGKPNWLSSQSEGCLTVLDLGEVDRELEYYECAYGANMAFRVSTLQQVGGFNVLLGRAGSHSLLSEEEVEVQEKIRKLGFILYYAVGARVAHLVEPERLSRHWLLARMAWQGVSTAVRETNLSQKSVRHTLLNSAEPLGLTEFVESLPIVVSPDDFDNKLRFVRDFLTYLLLSKNFDDNYNHNELPTNNRPIPYQLDYKPSAPIPCGTRILFFDSFPGHHYLYDLYGELPHSHFLKVNFHQWHNNDGRDLKYLELTAIDGVETLVILTLDAYVYGPNYPHFLDFVTRQVTVSVFGFLHKMPSKPEEVERLQEVAPNIGLILLDPNLAELVQELTRSINVHYLPHHAVLENLFTSKQRAVRRRQLPKDKIIISLLGELRKGKGVEKMMDAIDFISSKVKPHIFFLIVGKATSVEPQEIQYRFLQNGIAARIISGSEGSSYKFVTDPELADYVCASDLGLLLYNGLQENCASGILPNYLMNRIPVLSSDSSIVGRFVLEQKLGWVCDIESSSKIAEGIENAVKTLLIGEGSIKPGVQASVGSANVVRRLKTILSSDTWRQANHC